MKLNKINWQNAIGEIIIVIIGISIAFGLNNWAESRNDVKIEKQYLTILEEDLLQDTLALTENIEALEERIQNIGLLFYYYSGKSSISEDSAVAIFFSVLPNVDFYPQNTTYQTLINSGDFKLIKDFSLRSDIEKHYGIYEKLERKHFHYDEFSKRYIADFMMTKVDFSKVRQGNGTFIKNPQLRTILQSMYGILKQKLEVTYEAKESSVNLLEQI